MGPAFALFASDELDDNDDYQIVNERGYKFALGDFIQTWYGNIHIDHIENARAYDFKVLASR